MSGDVPGVHCVELTSGIGVNPAVIKGLREATRLRDWLQRKFGDLIT